MTDLNHQIARLLAAISARQSEPLFVFSEIMSSVQARYVENQLTADELAVSEPTVRRVELAEQIRDYMFTAARFYSGLQHVAAPDWLLQDSGDANDFPEFFAQLPSETELLSLLVAAGKPTLEQIQQIFVEWQEAVATEDLAASARKKVHALVDIRAFLVGLLRYLGVSTAEIQTAMEE